MFLRTVELSFARFQASRDPAALAIVFDRTAAELLRVARHLCGSEADAEDLVQATFLQVIETPAAHERGRPVLPWLLGVLANQARSARRRARRPIDPQRLRGDVVADVLPQVEANELGAALQAAIGRLPEAYRPVLRLWFEHGLEAQEIARTLERPAGTVRAQISRGLEQLRRFLPQSLAGGVAVAAVAGRGLAAVRSSVLGACKGTSTGIVATLALGGLLMLHHKLLASGAAAALVLLGWSLWSAVAGPIGTEVAAGRQGLAAATTDLPSAAPAPTPAGVEPAGPERTVATLPVPPAPAAAPTAGELVVRLVSARDGSPVVGMGVAVQHQDDLSAFARQSRFVPSDAAGVARFAGLAPATWHIDLDRLGAIAAGDVVAGTSVERRVEVPDGITVRGTVVDGRGQPVADAEVVVHGSRLSAPPVARTDALGRFSVDHLVANVELAARKSGRTPSLAHLVTGQPGAAVEMQLVVGDGGHHLTGRALDHEGRPIAGASVAVLADAARQATFWDRQKPQPRPLWLPTDADGRFATDELGADRYLVLVQPPTRAIAPSWQDIDTTRGDAFVELRAAAPAIVEGKVIGAGAGPIVVMASCVDRAEIGFLANLVGSCTATAAADGSYRLEGLLSGKIQVAVRRVFELLGETELDLVAGAVTRWDLDLSAPAGASADAPLEIEVHSAEALPPGVLVFVAPYVPDNRAPGMVPLGSDGKAQFTGKRQGGVDVTLTWLAGGRSIVQLAAVRDVQPKTTSVTFDLQPAQLPRRRVVGRLVDAAGAPLANEPIAVQRVADGMFTRVEATTGADGTFATIALPVGQYSINVGSPQQQQAVGQALVTADRDEDVGTLKVEGR